MPTQREEQSKKPKKRNLWPLKVFLIALFLSAIFSTFSQIALTGANILIAVVVLLIFLFLGLIADLVGVAVTVCDVTPFMSMAARKVHGAKTSIRLINAQTVVSSICNDIFGDICSIISGAIGANIAVKLATSIEGDYSTTLIAILVSSLIAAVTISGKALTKIYAIAHSHRVIAIAGVMLSIFAKDTKKTKKKKSPQD